MSNTADIYKALQDNQNAAAAAGGDKEDQFFRPTPGEEGKPNLYLVKLIPFTANGKTQLDISYQVHGWNSVKTGKYVTTGACTRHTTGKCNVCGAGYEAYLTKEQHAGVLKSKLLLPRDQNLVNVIIVDDPVNPENNGKEKPMRYAKSIDKIIKAALFGEDQDEFGARVLDCSKDGVLLRIACESKGAKSAKAPPSYDKSKFVSSAKWSLTKKEEAAAWARAIDLNTLIPETLPEAKAEALIKEHFHGSSKGATAAPAYREPTASAPSTGDAEMDPDIANLLAGLDGND